MNEIVSEYITFESNLSTSSDILGEFEREIRIQGFSGPADIPKLVFLVLYTGMSSKPVSLVIKGASGAGKSFALNMAAKFVPEHAYVRYEAMSEKALVYLPDLDLKHKHLIIGEASGLSEGNGRTLLRQLLSEGQVRYATVQSTSEGHKGANLPVLKGPTGLIMTTTASSLHPEDESRLLSVSIDSSPERIVEALIAQAKGFSNTTEPIDKGPWHALYEKVKAGPVEVDIPYAEDIAGHLPTTHERVKRDFPHVLSLIKAHALLHTDYRNQTDKPVVIANEDDYRNVYSLVNESLSQGLEVAVPENIREIVEAVQVLSKEDHLGVDTVSQIKLSDHLGRDRSVISRNVKKATEQGYLIDDSFGRGRVSSLRLGEKTLPSGSVLPAPEVLFNSNRSKDQG